MPNILKKGKYLISDPCYCYPDDDWQQNYDIFTENNYVEIDDYTLFSGSTAYGDGVYKLNKGNKIFGRIFVDAGLIAIIPVELVKKWDSFERMKKDEKRGLVKFIVLEDDTKVNYNSGDYSFGPFEILTGDDAEQIE